MWVEVAASEEACRERGAETSQDAGLNTGSGTSGGQAGGGGSGGSYGTEGSHGENAGQDANYTADNQARSTTKANLGVDLQAGGRLGEKGFGPTGAVGVKG